MIRTAVLVDDGSKLKNVNVERVEMKRFFSGLILIAVVLSVFLKEQTIVGANTFASASSMQRGNVAVRFAPKVISETNKKFRYTIKARYPQAIGAARDARLLKLNQELRELTNKGVSEFKADFTEPQELIGPTGSYYDSDYWVNLATNDLISLSFGVSTFGEGAAHPNHGTITFNYDLNAGKVLSLSDLFKPNSNYLGVISKYTVAQLKKKFSPNPDMDWIESGAGAKEENYKAWSLTRGGLQVTFDPYQVASYAEGEHVVVIPYAVLKNIVDPTGPLAGITGQR
jgi:hypothetical protein